MSLLYGDTGKAIEGVAKTVAITLATPYENNVDLDPTNTQFTTSLPLTQGSGGYSYTIQQKDLPAVTGATSMKYCAIMVVSGVATASGNVNIQAFKNGTSQASSNGVTVTASNKFWTATITRFYDVKVGDTLNAQLWATVAGISFDYVHVTILPTQVAVSQRPLKDVYYQNFVGNPLGNQPSTGGNFSISNNQYISFFPCTNSYNISITGGANTTVPYMQPQNGQLFKLAQGDMAQFTTTYANATNRSYQKCAVPSTITYRELMR